MCSAPYLTIKREIAMSRKPSIFISYKSSNREFALNLCSELEAWGFDVWIDAQRINGGQSWRAAIEKALRDTDIMLLVVTEEALLSAEVEAEWNYFLGEGKPLIPLIVEEVNIPARLRIIQWIDFRLDYNKSMHALRSKLDEFHTLTDEHSSSSNYDTAHSGEKQSSLPSHTDFDSFLYNLFLHNEKMLGIRYKEKYNENYHFRRESLYSTFEDFLESERKVMVFTGRAGTGKSSLVCDITREKLSQNFVWLQDCAHLSSDSDMSVEKYFLTTVALSQYDWIKIKQELTKRDKPLIFIFDAVNEYENPKILLEQIADFVIKNIDISFKVVITARTPVWNTIRRFLTTPARLEYHTSGPNSFVDVDTFTQGELPYVYEQYKKSFRLATNYNELSESIKSFLIHPLFLKLTSITYQGKTIPQDLAIEQVFRDYVLYCLGKYKAPQENVYATKEYLVLKRCIEIMFDRATRELQTIILNDDELLSFHSESNLLKDAYEHLVNEGLLSLKKDEVGFLEEIEIVFVTYERVFEYLLANIIINPVSVDKLLQMLKIANQKVFSQLRGATELAFGFAVINQSLDINAIIDIAKKDQGDTRQFLCDVIQTIYLSGNQDLGHQIIRRLIAEDEYNLNIIALQTAYHLGLDEYLVELSLAKDENLRNMASIFIYRRWDKARLIGKLEDGYLPLKAISAKINVRRPNRSLQALHTLTFLSLNMLARIIDDKQSLVPLIDIWQVVTSRVPKLDPIPTNEVRNPIGKLVYEGVFAVVSTIVKRFTEDTRISENKLQEFWLVPQNRRAFMDSPVLHETQDLWNYQKEITTLLEWDHPLVNYLTCDPLIHHIYTDPEAHLNMSQEIFDMPQKHPFRIRYSILHAQAYSAAFRLMRGQSITDHHYELLKDNIIDLWYTAHEITDSGVYRYVEEGTVASGFEESFSTILLAVFIVEALRQSEAGKITGSEILKTVFTDPISKDFTDEHIGLFIKIIERYAYQGIPEFSIYTLVDRDIKSRWEKAIPEAGIVTFSNIRVFFQQEVDSILREVGLIDTDFFNQIRSSATMPETKDVLFTNNTVWALATSIEPLILKSVGSILIDIVFSSNYKELLQRLTRTSINIVTNYHVIDILIAQWYMLNIPGWDNFEELNIRREVLEEYPEISDYWQREIHNFIDKFGRGVLHGDL
jgi:hypothetical protein